MSSKQREALDQIYKLLSIGGKPDTAMCIRYEAAFQMAKEALAEPILNCEVGTAKEQEKRFTEFCDAHKYVGDSGVSWCLSDCPFYNKMDCGVWWAQMPYEKGKTDE